MVTSLLLPLLGCHGSHKTTGVMPSNTTASVCAEPKGKVLAKGDDIDGDGRPDLITQDGDVLRLYLQRGECFREAGRVYHRDGVEPSVSSYKGTISVSTKLPHGDRLRATYRYQDGRLTADGRPTVIPPPSSSGGRGQASATTDASRTAAAFSDLRARRATIFNYSSELRRCVDWHFDGGILIHDDAPHHLRYIVEVSQNGDRVDVSGTSVEELPRSDTELAGTGPGRETTLQLLRIEPSFIELTIVDSTDFDATAGEPELCRWYLTRGACEREHRSSPRCDF